MKRNYKSRATILLALLLIIGKVSAQDKSSTLSGYVDLIEDSTGLFFAPPNNIKERPSAIYASVLLINLNTNDSLGAGSYDTGKYLFEDVPAGKYRISTFHIYYEDYIDTISIEPNEQRIFNIKVGKIYSPEELPFGSNEAKEDLEKGIVQLLRLVTNIPLEYPEDCHKIISEINKEFGFQFKEFDYPVHFWGIEHQAVVRYNLEVMEYLSRVNGIDWQTRYHELTEKRLGFRYRRFHY